MNANSGQTGRDSAGLERNTDAIREDMNRTLDEIERKLSPGQLLDRSLGYLREHGGSIAESVGDTVRQSPLPALLTAAGLLWMVTSYRSSRRDEADGDTDSDLHNGDYEGSQYSGVSGMEPGRARSTSDTEDSMRSKARSGLASAGNRVRNVEEAVAGRVREGATKASDAARKTMQSTRRQTQRARQGFRQMVDEQPLTVAAMGLAVGALLSAALPTTEWEKRTLGQARDRALVKAKEVGEETYDELRDTLRGAPAGSESKHPQQEGYSS
jgi:ElaB/YqjD/DUF883 family membrane-anchored ribosome-binding protein